jgi:putative nucleotidyltransferase with HDIG domain
MEFVRSAELALGLLAERRFDVIVTDVRMPRMDGAELLQITRERWPQVVRIAISGYSNFEQTVRLAPVAHQYLSKPCEPEQLDNIITRCLALQETLAQPGLRSAVGQMRRLPAIPETYSKLQTAMASENVSIQEIAAIVSRDTVIVAKLLQLVNSSFFRLARQVTKVEQAIAYLGLSTVRNLVLSAEVFCKWPASAERPILDHTKLQNHALRVATAAHALTTNTPIANDAVLAALLHDIGYWVLAQERSAALSESLCVSAAEHVSIDVAETRVLGASHAEIGAYLLGIWGFPSTIVEAVAHHHAPRRVPQTSFDVLATLAVAHALTDTSDADAFTASAGPRMEVDVHYLDSLHAPFTWTEAQQRVAEALAAEGTAP